MSNPRNRIRLLGTLTIAALAVAMLAGPASAATNPPGNNGTVKIDDTPFDDHPNNEPHVGCTFEVDFYGFDEGDLSAEVAFEAHPPTGPVQPLLTDTVFIGQDDNGGGGSEAGLDASKAYTLDLSVIEPHPIQGVHVKLTVHADGSQGADTKYKVFWVTGCPPGTTTTTISSSSSSTSTSSTSPTTTTVQSSTSSTLSESSTSTSRQGDTTTTLLGAGPISSSAGGGSLPRTGGNALVLLLASLGLAGAGAATIVATRRRQAEEQ